MTDQAGNPIPEFTVIPRRHPNENSIQELRTNSVNGKAGSFEIEIKDREAKYGLTIEANGYRTISTPAFERGQIPKSLDLKMQKAPSIKYKAVDAKGDPLVGAIAVAIPDGQNSSQMGFIASVGEWLQHSKADENGMFEFPATSEPRTIFLYGKNAYGEAGDFPDRPAKNFSSSELNDIKIAVTLNGQPWKTKYFFRVIRYFRGLNKQNDTYRLGTSDDGGRIQVKSIPGLPCSINIVDSNNPRRMRYHLAFKPEGKEVNLDFANATAITASVRFQGGNSSRVQMTRSRFQLRRLEPAIALPTDMRIALKEFGLEQLNVNEISQRLYDKENWDLKRAYDDYFDTYTGMLSEEGSFSIDVLRKGKYVLSIFAEAESTSRASAHPLSQFHQEIEIGDQALNIGTLNVDVYDDPLPESQVEDFEFMIDGQTELSRLSALRGQYVLIDFWSPWCDVCERDTPRLHLLAKALAKTEKTTILSIEAHGNGRTVRIPDQIPTGLNWFNAQLIFKKELDIQKRMGVWESQRFVLIDPAGKFIASGSLAPITMKLREIGLK